MLGEIKHEHAPTSECSPRGHVMQAEIPIICPSELYVPAGHRRQIPSTSYCPQLHVTVIIGAVEGIVSVTEFSSANSLCKVNL